MSGGIVVMYRARVAIMYASVLAVFTVMLVLDRLPRNDVVESATSLFMWSGIVGMLTVVLLALVGPRFLPERDPITVIAPVLGRWSALNSPATKVPSHGIRAYGQAYAIDLAYEPTPDARPKFGSGSPLRRPQEYPAFGQPVRAMVDGVVVKASDRLRDHRARASWLTVLYMLVEGAVRELAGPRFVIGNHVVIRADDDVFALAAHVRQGSARVGEGERVTAGQIIAECGNSGNSSEPHVHAQLMDRASTWTGQGIPFAASDVIIGDDPAPQNALPADGQLMTAN